MSRAKRCVIPLLPHHVTQRGARKQQVFFSPDDRRVYLELLAHYAPRYHTEILAYTLMINHVHHLLVPHEHNSLQWTLQMTHKRYAEYVNAQRQWTGHLWQSKFYSSPVDESFFWVALRYIYRNPVEANIAVHPEEYPWSSARAHCGKGRDPYITTGTPWSNRIALRTDWSSWLQSPNDVEKIRQLRIATLRDRPTGSEEFLKSLEREYGIVACQPPLGRPRKAA